MSSDVGVQVPPLAQIAEGQFIPQAPRQGPRIFPGALLVSTVQGPETMSVPKTLEGVLGAHAAVIPSFGSRLAPRIPGRRTRRRGPGADRLHTPEDPRPVRYPHRHTAPAVQKFRLGTAANPATLDPAVSGDNETFRITRQIFEGLIGVDRETGAPIPLLATDWISSPDRLQYTFILRRDVKFHDGTDFDAEAVVLNFQRWAALPKDAKADSDQGFTQVFRYNDSLPKLPDSMPAPKPVEGPDGQETVDPQLEAEHQAEVQNLENLREQLKANPFIGASTGASASYFGSIKAAGTHTVVLTLRRPITGLIEALTLPGLVIASPTALGRGPAEPGHASALSTHPVGTGPYAFASWKGNTVEVARFADYWDATAFANNPEAPTLVSFRETSTPAMRLGELRRGEIDGFDMVTVTGLRELVREGKLIVQRDPFSVAYLGMNQKNKWLAKPEFRQAIAHSIDRQKIIDAYYISGTKEARGFLPASLGIKPSDTYYGPDLQRSKALLAEAGLRRFPRPVPVPAEHLARLSAAARTHLCGNLPPARHRGHQHRTDSGGLDRRLCQPGAIRAPRPGCTCWASTAGTATPMTSWAGSSPIRTSNSATTRPSCRRKSSWPGRFPAARSGSTPTRTFRAPWPRTCRRCRWPSRFPGWRSTTRCRNYPSSPVLDEVFSDVKLNTK